jgi:hypothetical protein
MTDGFWHSLVSWLFSPRTPLAVRLLQNEIGRLSDENRRLNDLLTQAYESRGVIPIQPERRELSPPAQVQRQSYADVEIELQKKDAEDFEAFQREESARLARVAEYTRDQSKPN